MKCITSFRSQHKEAISLFLAEFIGTFMLVAIGDGTAATYHLRNDQSRSLDVFVMCLGFGVGNMIAMFAGSKISGAQVNPAVTVAYAVKGDVKWKNVPIYLIAQYLGSFVAATVLWINCKDAIDFIDGGHHIAYQQLSSASTTGSIFATYPASHVSFWGALIDQIIGTSVLLFGMIAVSDKNNLNLDMKHRPFMITLVITMTCVAFNTNCGAIFNPARDLSPRLLTYLVGYGSEVFDNIHGTYWFFAAVVGPHVGAILGVYVYRIFIETSLEEKDRYDLSEVVEMSDTKKCNNS